MDKENKKPAVSNSANSAQSIIEPAVLASTNSTTRSGRRRGQRGEGSKNDRPPEKPPGKRGPDSPNSVGKFSWLTRDTGRTITTIYSTQLQASITPVSSSSGFELLCTYNWVSTFSPTIYVPGGPPQWTPVTLPTTLSKDAGTQFIDQNAFRAPAFPFEPMFAALDAMTPDYDFAAVDLVTNRNSLRKLLNFASGRAPDSFRIDVSMVHDTLFLTRRERSTRDLIRGPHNSGYGHNFEKAFTKAEKGLEESSGHHRVVRYRMGDLDCVVRFEVDAWCEDKGEEVDLSDRPKANSEEIGTGTKSEDMLAELTKLSLNQGPTSKRSAQENDRKSDPQMDDTLEKTTQPLLASSKDREKPAWYKHTHVIGRGRLVPSSTLAEIKTKKKRSRLAEALPQLWFGRTPLLLHATHDEGRFTEQVERINAGDKFEDWETKQQEVLRKMVALIKELRNVAMQAKDGACVVVVCENKARPLRLEIFEDTARKKVLPEEIVERYWGGREGSLQALEKVPFEVL